MYKTLFSKQLISGTSSFCAKKAPGLFPILDNFRHYLEHLPKESIQNTNSTAHIELPSGAKFTLSVRL